MAPPLPGSDFEISPSAMKVMKVPSGEVASGQLQPVVRAARALLPALRKAIGRGEQGPCTALARRRRSEVRISGRGSVARTPHLRAL